VAISSTKNAPRGDGVRERERAAAEQGEQRGGDNGGVGAVDRAGGGGERRGGGDDQRGGASHAHGEMAAGGGHETNVRRWSRRGKPSVDAFIACSAKVVDVNAIRGPGGLTDLRP
jgi:hypothetical protein